MKINKNIRNIFNNINNNNPISKFLKTRRISSSTFSMNDNPGYVSVENLNSRHIYQQISSDDGSFVNDESIYEEIPSQNGSLLNDEPIYEEIPAATGSVVNDEPIYEEIGERNWTDVNPCYASNVAPKLPPPMVPTRTPSFHDRFRNKYWA